MPSNQYVISMYAELTVVKTCKNGRRIVKSSILPETKQNVPLTCINSLKQFSDAERDTIGPPCLPPQCAKSSPIDTTLKEYCVGREYPLSNFFSIYVEITL